MTKDRACTSEMPRILAVGAVIRDTAGRVLLVKRANAPGAGTWSVPGGKVDPDETLTEAVRREVLEETGLIVAVGPELWRVDVPAAGHGVFEVHDFAVRVEAGQLLPGDDAADARWFTSAEAGRLGLSDCLHELLTAHGVFE